MKMPKRQEENKKQWKSDYKLLKTIWEEFLGDASFERGKCVKGNFGALRMRLRDQDIRDRLMTPSLCEDWDRFISRTKHIDDGDALIAGGAHNRLVNIAQHLGQADGCEKDPWDYRVRILDRVQIPEGLWSSVWPEEGVWKVPGEYLLSNHQICSKKHTGSATPYFSMQENPAMTNYREREQQKKEWRGDWMQLTTTWAKLPYGNEYATDFQELELDMRPNFPFGKRYVTPQLREEWDRITEKTKSWETKGNTMTEQKVLEYNKFLVKIAKNHQRSTGCSVYPWDYRKRTLMSADIDPMFWENIWPEEGDWKRQDKVRHLEWKTYTEVLEHAENAFTKGDVQETWLWLRDGLSGLMNYVGSSDGLNLPKTMRVLTSPEDRLGEPENREEILEAFGKVRKGLEEKAMGTTAYIPAEQPKLEAVKVKETLVAETKVEDTQVKKQGTEDSGGD
ncbi:hypothetical protein K491DRAFT_779692 [Lophiostoma macrostomum CBS 122681]|uniref:Uncharacterized protein n=1 Tax=Lophiostoma macrostomum CBS 122681 TaxID=1314788 RepID=A0A6A6T3M8_9PLEO|nr:hypothetical protein K491DRAFT_779692 [Lophiostoma macrostomum CBS 122681]